MGAGASQRQSEERTKDASALSAGEKCFSTRPLTIIKVQHEATARVVQPWVAHCDWLKGWR